MRLRRSAASRATAALALAAAALPALGAAPLALRAEPPALVLGAGEGATITIDGGAAAELPRVTANVGRIVNLRALGDGRFAAEYLPPPTSHPQVAIVAAHSAERWGSTAIPLWGRGLATARSAPHAEIRVTIGDASFGPVRADAAGEAHVPVVVPAGVERAYHRDKPLDLRIPPSLHVLVALERDAAPADVDQDVPLRVFAVTPAGAPREAAPVVVEVTHGELVGLAEVAPGELAATWRLPRGKAGPASAEARLADEPALASAVTLARAAGAPARVALESDRARAVAGEASPVALRVRVMDAAGNPADGEPRIAATLGDVSALVAIAPGTWEARLAVPAAVRWWARRSEVSARAGGVEGRIAIDIAPAPVPPGARTRRVSAAPKLGVAASRGGLAAAYLGAEGAYRPSLLGGRLSLALEVGGFVRDRTDEVTIGEQLLTIHGRARYLPVIAGARFQHALGKRHAAWAGAGAGLAHVASEVSVGSGPVTSESGVVPVLYASAGWGLRAGRATPFAEARLAWHAAPDFVGMRGSLATLTLLVGCRYDAL
jgi:hypothetical protein